MHRSITGSLLLSALLCATLAVSQSAPPQNPPPEPKIRVGDTAPDFTLRDQNGNQVKLADFHGKKNVVLAFYVFAFTGG